ncbi:MAG: hypothetical protein V4489_04990 [Chlamydiota bacterium]
MKFQQLVALEQHVESSFTAKNFSRLYLVVHSQREERRKLLEKVSEKISGLAKAEVSFHEGRDWDFIYNVLGTPSLFGTQEVIVWDSSKGLPEEAEEKFLRYVANPSPWAFLLIGVDSFKSFSKLYKEASKDIVILDLSEEKPWDKEKRQQQEILQKVKQEGKNITPGALARLLLISEDSLTLESELMKVLSYIGDRSSIVEKDVEAVTAAPLVTRWQMAEELIWENGKDYEIEDLSALLALVGQIRFLLHQARRISTYVQEKKSPESIMKAVNIRSAALQKTLQRIKSCKGEYFNSALAVLCDLEVLAKNSSLDSNFLFHYLRMQLAQLRQDYVR